jgi:hypothetical protein
MPRRKWQRIAVQVAHRSPQFAVAVLRRAGETTVVLLRASGDRPQLPKIHGWTFGAAARRDAKEQENQSRSKTDTEQQSRVRSLIDEANDHSG